jgi:L-ascorbate metabolism protein UlaG (beta-lactamase superfamily)
MDQYLYNPDLSFINKNYKGNLVRNGKFTNYSWPDTDASFLKVISWMLSKNPQRKEKKKDDFKVKVIKDPALFESKEDMIVWLGHASFFIRLNGKNLLFDPVYYKIPFVKKYVEFPCPIENIKGIDYLLLSHGHRDHFDEPTLKKILPKNPNLKILCPLKIGTLVKAINKNADIQEAGWYQQYNIEDDIKITLLPALHWNKRGLIDFNTSLWGSFMLETKNQKIFYAGDTAYGTHFKEIRNVMGTPDICILPIGAYKPSFIMKNSHMSPHEAIEAFKDLGGKIFIPMHYGTFDLADEPLGEPIRIVRNELNNPHLKELAVGEKFLL